MKLERFGSFNVYRRFYFTADRQFGRVVDARYWDDCDVAPFQRSIRARSDWAQVRATISSQELYTGDLAL